MAKKRANGEGTIRKRKDGRWEARYTDINEINPNKKRKYIYAKTQKDLIVKLQMALSEMHHQNTLPPESLMTVEQWFREWISVYGVIAYRNTTYSCYNMMINAYIVPSIGKIKLCNLKTIDIQMMFNNLFFKKIKKNGKIGLAPASLAKPKNLISKAFMQAKVNGFILSNPIDGLVLPSAETKDIRIFNKEDLILLNEAISGHSIEWLIKFMLLTGARIGEALALKIDDIDFINKKLKINKTVSYVPDKSTNQFGFCTNEPKTKSGFRDLSLTPVLESLLNIQIKNNDASKNNNKNRWEENHLLFPNAYGGYQSGNKIGKKFTKLQKSSGMSNTKSLHILRHTFATTALNAGISLPNIAKMIGHKNGEITLRFYGHYLEDDVYNQAVKLAEALGQFINLKA